MIWLKFVICVIIILIAGSKAAKYGDIIAEKSGLGRIRIGMLLLAVVTSMPELVTSVSSVSIVKDADLGFSTLIGSIVFNLCIISVLDVFHRPEPVLSRVKRRHVRLVAIGIALSAICIVGMLLEPKLSFLSVGWVGILTPVILIIYIISTFRISSGERSAEILGPIPEQLTEHEPWKTLGPKFAICAIAIIGCGIWLSYLGDEIALSTGWGRSFVGSLFLAITTSLPELTVAIAAIRLGAMDLAIADILGANMLDLAYVAVADVIYTGGPILSAISRANLVVLSVFIAMNLVILVGLRYQKNEKTFRVFHWYSPLLIALYIIGSFILFISNSAK